MAVSTPSLSALLVCDSIIEEKATNKKSLIGTFTDIWARDFPCTHPNIGIYFCLTNAEGDYELTVRLFDSDREKSLGETTAYVNISDILSINDFGLNLRGMVFEQPGRYEFRLYANKEFMGRKEFRVFKPEGEKK